MSVFAGGARLSEIEAIAALEPVVPDALETLETLVDRSLVSTRRNAADDRFALLEPMRVYGRELLVNAGEGPAVVGKHAAIYGDLARAAEPEFYGRARRASLERLANDHDNLRGALDELRDRGELAAALELAADLWRFWQLRGHLTEGRERLDELLAAAAAPGARVSPFVLSRAEEAAGSVRYWLAPDRDIPRNFYERSLAHAIESGDQARIAWSKYNLAFAFDFTPAPEMGLANVDHATALREEALDAFRKLGDRRGVAESLWAMGGNALIILSDPHRAKRLLIEARTLLDDVGDTYAEGWALNSLALISAAEGDFDGAELRLREAGALFGRDLHGEPGEIVGLLAFGSVAARRGDDVTAVRIAAAGEAAARALGAEIPRIGPIMDELAAAASRLPPDVLERERAVGVAMGAGSMLSTLLESPRRSTQDPVSLGSGSLE
jgi:non-specific serine/threonine protein kinase